MADSVSEVSDRDVELLLDDIESKLIAVERDLQGDGPDIDGLLLCTESILDDILIAIDVSEEQLASLLCFQFKIADIATMLQVSPSTISRRILEFGLSDALEYSSITDSDLEAIACEYAVLHPNSGQKSFSGYLSQLGFRVQRHRVRNALIKVDPNGVRSRLRKALHRRQYNVPMPNSLWHIDGHHKLIRWHIIIHGGIDGFSRLPVFLRASTDNSADTVLQHFINAVALYGLPSRLFYDMEDAGVLDLSSEKDLFCLHYVFIPRIQQQLDIFRESYSHHKLRSEGNMTPYQLWIQGMSTLNSDLAAVEGSLEESSISEYGIDWTGPCRMNNTEDVILEVYSCPLTDEQLLQLKQVVDPMQLCGDFGVSIYFATRQFVYSLSTS
ncbi:hypothetical protein EMCRGX_G013427 [Ephydatia muelleri]